MKIVDLLEMLPQLRVAITQGTSIKGVPFKEEQKEEAQAGKETNTLFTTGLGMTPAVVEMEIMGCKLSNTIVDGGLGVNVLPDETLKALRKPTLWSPTFQLVGKCRPAWNQLDKNSDGTKGSNWNTTVLLELCGDCPREEGVRCIIGERMANLNKS